VPDDIVTRLRQWALVSFQYPTSELLPSDLTNAADEIERLRAEVRDMDRRIVTLIGEHQALAIAYASAVTRG
jgi:hypothetical protein